MAAWPAQRRRLRLRRYLHRRSTGQDGDPFFLAIAARLENPETGNRRASGCRLRAPASSNLRSGDSGRRAIPGKAADHLEVADAICYDGTPNHRELAHGPSGTDLRRQSSPSPGNGRRVLDRGVPLTLATVETQVHLQAVIGYDEERGTLLDARPDAAGRPAVLVRAFPRPATARSALAGWPSCRAIALNCSWGSSFLRCSVRQASPIGDALEKHDRQGAAQEHKSLETAAGGHRLELMARHALASYDADPRRNAPRGGGVARALSRYTNLRLAQLALLHSGVVATHV